jgi:RimJ/RimL family protein N-acetyltransferase
MMERLAEDKLKNCSLPLKPVPIEFTGKIVKLKPLDIARDSEVLFFRTNGSPIVTQSKSLDSYDHDKLIWQYFAYGPFNSLDEFRSHISEIANSPNMLTFCVFDVETDLQIGMATLINQPQYLKIEIGHVIYSPIAQRTGANLEACYLLLSHCFKLGYRRAEWKCHSLNVRSHRAALNIGFTFEFTQMYHMISKGANRDTSWFRILDFEWEDVKKKLEHKLYQSEVA